jgi:GT2 family glycosyltransferase
MTQPQVSVVLVSWNSGASLTRCLDALTQQSCPRFEVILIDNGSSDGSIDGLRERFPDLPLHIEEYSANRGFAAACNSGVRIARARWIALLNTDAFPEPDWLANLLNVAEASPGYSFFASRQIQANDHRLLDGAGDAYHVSGMAWRQYLGYPADLYGLEAREVFSPCAAAALYERQAFLDAGGFDEDFFSYLEDVDLGFRLRLRGNRCLYVPQAVVYHVGSASLGVGSDFAFYHAHRNLIWSFVQNMPTRMFWKYLLAHIMANLIHLGYYSLWLPRKAKAIWRGKWDAMRGLRRAFSKRKEIQSRRRVGVADLERVMEHGLMKPYLRGYFLRRTRRVYPDLKEK